MVTKERNHVLLRCAAARVATSHGDPATHGVATAWAEVLEKFGAYGIRLVKKYTRRLGSCWGAAGGHGGSRFVFEGSDVQAVHHRDDG